MKKMLKIVITTGAELRETEKCISKEQQQRTFKN